MSSQDDEYRWAGVEDPKVVLTTSRDPSARLKMFTKVRHVKIGTHDRDSILNVVMIILGNASPYPKLSKNKQRRIRIRAVGWGM